MVIIATGRSGSGFVSGLPAAGAAPRSGAEAERAASALLATRTRKPRSQSYSSRVARRIFYHTSLSEALHTIFGKGPHIHYCIRIQNHARRD